VHRGREKDRQAGRQEVPRKMISVGVAVLKSFFIRSVWLM
jgi:hypothetical protein